MDPITAEQVMGEDGALNDNWRDFAFEADDPLRTNEGLANIKNIRGMAHQIVSGESTIGKLSGGREFAILPNADSDEAEVNEYRTKRGVPGTADEYGLKALELPDGLPKNDVLADHMAGILHKAGATKSEAEAIFQGYAEFMKTATDDATAAMTLEDQESNTKLRKLWGAGYENKLALATNAANVFGFEISPEETAALIKELPNDPFSAQLLAKAGEVIAEKGLKQDTVVNEGLTPAESNIAINKVMSDPYYITASPAGKPVNRALHDSLVEKVQKMFAAQNEVV